MIAWAFIKSYCDFLLFYIELFFQLSQTKSSLGFADDYRAVLRLYDAMFPSKEPPSKHEALTQCSFNVGPPSSTSAQH